MRNVIHFICRIMIIINYKLIYTSQNFDFLFVSFWSNCILLIMQLSFRTHAQDERELNI